MRLDLKVKRISKNLTQEQMASLINLSTSSYSFLEQGRSDGTYKVWCKIQQTLNIPDEEMWKVINHK